MSREQKLAQAERKLIRAMGEKPNLSWAFLKLTRTGRTLGMTTWCCA